MRAIRREVRPSRREGVRKDEQEGRPHLLGALSRSSVVFLLGVLRLVRFRRLILVDRAQKHSELVNIQEALGGSATAPYPDDRFDIMWILHRHRLVAKESEKCQGLDDHRRMRYDPDLEVEDEWDAENDDGEDNESDRVDDGLEGDAGEPYNLVVESQFVLGS